MQGNILERLGWYRIEDSFSEKKNLKKNAEWNLIKGASESVIKDCDRLLKKHGSETGVGQHLQLIRNYVTYVYTYGDGNWPPNTPKQVYNEASKQVNLMKGSLKQIAIILETEFKKSNNEQKN